MFATLSWLSLVRTIFGVLTQRACVALGTDTHWDEGGVVTSPAILTNGVVITH